MAKTKTNNKVSKKSAWRGRNARKNIQISLRFGAVLVVLFAIGGGILASNWFESKKDVNAASCSISDKLVNSCRPWLSAVVGGYPQVGGNEQFAFFNKRLNNPNVLNNPNAATTLTYKMDIPHVYHTPGQSLFNGDAQRTLNDTSLYGSPSNPVLVNWKPGNRWADTANGAADTTIVNSAKAVKSLGSRKIFLTLWHEPENDNVTDVGVNITENCKRPTGSSGSAADYRAMWRHVRDIFDQQGVTNVVWFWNPMGYVGNNAWDCIVKPLYPGNDLVDWIMWDPYSSNTGDFVGSVSKFYNWMLQNGDNGQYNFASKTWGLAEHGSNSDPANAAGYWRKAKEAILANTFPKIKLYSVFDTSVNGGVNGGLRVGYNNLGTIDTTEQTAFSDYAMAVLNYGDSEGGGVPAPPPPPPPTGDSIPPSVSIASPANNSTQKGTITIVGQATDNVKVTAVTLRVNDKWIATDETAPYSFQLDTKKHKDGQYALVLRAWDPSGNAGQSQTVIININNNAGPGGGNGDPITSPVITPSTPTSPNRPLIARGRIIVSPSTPGNAIQVKVGDEWLDNNVIDTSSLPNGTHKVTVVENGKTTEQYISVKNPLPIAIVNHVRAKAVPYAVGSTTVVLLALLWVGRGYLAGLGSRKERKLQKAQRDYRGK